LERLSYKDIENHKKEIKKQKPITKDTVPVQRMNSIDQDLRKEIEKFRKWLTYQGIERHSKGNTKHIKA
jgi:hypothetical protein